MNRSLILPVLLGLLAGSAARGQGIAAGSVVGTGFEISEGYTPGDLNGQAGWQAGGGTAEIWAQTVYSGTLAARVAPGGTLSRETPVATSRVTFKGHLQANPSAAPELPLTGQAAALYLDPAYGITGLDGDGQGGGNWVGSGRSIPPGTWFELTVVLDFERRTWDCAVDGQPALQGLRFPSDSVAAFRSLSFAADTGDTLVDQLTLDATAAPSPVEPDLISSGSLGTGFEPDEGYSVGNIDSQNGWSVDEGRAEVWTQTVFSGSQAARIAPGGRMTHGFATGLPNVTFTSYVQANPTQAPEIPLIPQAAILYLDPVNGLTALDGDGQGGGRWVGSQIIIPAGTWFELTLELDFESKKWDCLVNGQPALYGLHFHSDNVVTLGLLTAAASGADTLLDAARVSATLPPASTTTPPGPIVGTPVGFGFEPAEGYFPGDLDTQDAWSVDAGQAEVWTTLVYSGQQAARIAAGGRISHEFATGLPIVHVRTYVQATASPAPEIPLPAQAAVLYLDASNGVTGLDGNGSGGGNWVGSGVTIPAGQWFELSLRLDFNRKTWDCLVDGRPALVGLHFHSDSITAFGSLTASASAGDTLIDAASIAVEDAAVQTDIAVLPSLVGFEPGENYSPGDVNGQEGWSVETGDSQVWSTSVYSGVQAARIGPGSRMTRDFATADSIVTVEAYLRANPTEPPALPDTAQIAVLYLDPRMGITGLDGDGNGGGQWVGSGLAAPADTWFRTSIRMDFVARTWSCAINGIQVLSNLHFHSSGIPAFTSFTAGASPSGLTLIDQITVVSESVPITIPTPPRLSIALAGADVEISWPTDATLFRLQVTETLDNPIWVDVASSGNKATEHPQPLPRFYRLVTP